MPIAALQVAASADDADVDGFSASNNANSTRTFLIGQAVNGTASWWWHFYRWAVPIPQGATINSAILEIYVYSGNDDPWGAWHADLQPNSPNAVTDPKFQNRTLTTAKVQVNTQTVGVGWWSPPDLKDVIQEVISQPAWVSGNGLSLIYKPDHNASPPEPLYCRSWDFDPTLAPKLTIDWTPAAEGAPRQRVRKRVRGLLSPAVLRRFIPGAP